MSIALIFMEFNVSLEGIAVKAPRGNSPSWSCEFNCCSFRLRKHDHQLMHNVKAYIKEQADRSQLREPAIDRTRPLTTKIHEQLSYTRSSVKINSSEGI
mgnify:CR=1 FL=1